MKKPTYILIEKKQKNPEKIAVMAFDNVDDLIRHREHCQNTIVVIIKGEIVLGTKHVDEYYG